MEDHIRIDHRCGACDRRFQHSDTIVALSWIAEDAFVMEHHPFPYPQSPNCSTYSDEAEVHFCQITQCAHCAEGPPSASVHKDCLKIFEDVNPDLSILWKAICWKSMPQDSLQPNIEPYSDGGRLIRWMAATGERRILDSLSSPLPRQICEDYHSSKLARHIAAWTLADRWKEAIQGDEITLPLEQIYEWRRGDTPAPVLPFQVLGNYVELTFDVLGLLRIRKLNVRPVENSVPPAFPAPTTKLFVVEQAHVFADITVTFQLPFAQLNLNQSLHHLRPWDTSCPPDWNSCVIEPSYSYSGNHFTTIDLLKCVSITFFCIDGMLWSVQAHKDKNDSALRTWETFDEPTKRMAEWHHVPFGDNDRLTSFGWIASGKSFPFFQFELSKSGNVTLNSGPIVEDQEMQVVRNSRYMIFESLPTGQMVFVGAEPADPRQIATTLFHNPHAKFEVPFRGAYHSSAPLEGVQQIHVFTQQRPEISERIEDEICKGILLEYSDGGVRALGECRIGVDVSRYLMTAMPKYIHVASIQRHDLIRGLEMSVAQVAVSDDGQVDENRSFCHWETFEMKGTLHFWYSKDECKLIFRD